MVTILVYIRAATVPFPGVATLPSSPAQCGGGPGRDMALTIVFTYSAIESHFHARVSRWIFATRRRAESRVAADCAVPSKVSSPPPELNLFARSIETK